MKSKEKAVLLKCAEELSELVARILQHHNKNKDYSSHILEEIEDVSRQLKIIKKVFS